jgi:hypothetical protein
MSEQHQLNVPFDSPNSSRPTSRPTSRPSSGPNTPRSAIEVVEVKFRLNELAKSSADGKPDSKEVPFKSNLEEFHSFLQTDGVTRELFAQYAQVGDLHCNALHAAQRFEF